MKGRKAAGPLHLSSVQLSPVSDTPDSQLPGERFVFRTEPEYKFLVACQPVGYISDMD